MISIEHVSLLWGQSLSIFKTTNRVNNMTRMISLKEAINIFEKHKIEKVTNKNPFLFRSEFKSPSDGGELGEFSANNYILEKVKELKGQRAKLWDDTSGKSLYHFLSKKYHHDDGTTSTSTKLRLYGKKYRKDNGPDGNSDIEYERVYLDYYDISSQDIELVLNFNEKITIIDKIKREITRLNNDVTDRQPCDLFEDYNYIGFYII